MLPPPRHPLFSLPPAFHNTYVSEITLFMCFLSHPALKYKLHNRVRDVAILPVSPQCLEEGQYLWNKYLWNK